MRLRILSEVGQSIEGRFRKRKAEIMTGLRFVERVFLSILCLVFIACGGGRETDHAEKGAERSHKEDHPEAKEGKGHKEDASGSKEAIKLSGDAIKNMGLTTAEVNLKPTREKIRPRQR